jgi:hypothetical protein
MNGPPVFCRGSCQLPVNNERMDELVSSHEWLGLIVGRDRLPSASGLHERGLGFISRCFAYFADRTGCDYPRQLPWLWRMIPRLRD